MEYMRCIEVWQSDTVLQAEGVSALTCSMVGSMDAQKLCRIDRTLSFF